MSESKKVRVRGMFWGILLCFCLLAHAAMAGEEEANKNWLTVQVIKIDDRMITAVVGEMGEGAEGVEPPTQGMEAPPQGVNGTGAGQSLPKDGDMTPPMPPAAGETPADGAGQPERPQGGPMGGGNAFVVGEQQITFTVGDETMIEVEFLQGSQAGDVKSIAVGAVLKVELAQDNEARVIVVKNMQAGGGFGGSKTITQGTTANLLDVAGNYEGGLYRSTGDDENALRVSEVEVFLDKITVEKTGGASSNTEDGDFYGQNAAFLATDGAAATIEGAVITSQAVNGNAVFSYGEGTAVSIADSTITTLERNSGGLQTAGGAQMYATNLVVSTAGASSAAIRSDRGGGVVRVYGGQYETGGTGSPAIYSTADVSVFDAVLSAAASESVVVEGKNSVVLENCMVMGNMQGTYGSGEDQHIHNIMIYQSMSGDAEVGHATFQAKNGSIVSQAGDMFYVTNTSCDIRLSGVELTLANDVLLSVVGNDGMRGWGLAGANGGNVAMSVAEQVLQGTIIVDEISSLQLTLGEGSLLEGSVNGMGQAGDVTIVMDDSSQWVLTADSYITSFQGSVEGVQENGFTLYVNEQPIESGVAETR